MYASDHPPPHVHVQLRDGRECTVQLASLALAGRVRPAEIRSELRWIETNRTKLLEEWLRLNP